jgi:subtilisin family serine protease
VKSVSKAERKTRKGFMARCASRAWWLWLLLPVLLALKFALVTKPGPAPGNETGSERPSLQADTTPPPQSRTQLASEVLRSSPARPRSAASLPQFVPGRLLVKPQAQLAKPELVQRLGIQGVPVSITQGPGNLWIVNLPEARVGALLAALKNNPGIEYAERDGIGWAAFVPNDPYVTSGQEWHLEKIQAFQAWDFGTGTTNIPVAILDSGIYAAHPEFAGHVLPGYDFVNGDTNTADDFGHGTAVAGVVAAAGNNGLGVAGVAYGCAVLPVKVVDATGSAAYSAIAQGIHYAVDQGARVINISIAGNSASDTLQEAVDYAWSHNAVVVAAAGNTGSSTPQYPAACSNAVAVGATAPDDSLASFSSFGSFLTLTAPGVSIWTTQNDLSNPYGAWSGTSFASPIVAGIATLLVSANPSLSNSQIVAQLEQTADDLGAPGYDTTFGYGRVNAFRAASASGLNVQMPSPINLRVKAAVGP